MVRIGLVVIAVAALVACGGKGKKEDTAPTDESGLEGGEETGGGDGDMVPPEKMDSIQRTLDHRRDAASRCLSTAVSEGKTEKNTRGKITVGLKISPAGKAHDVTVQKTSIESQDVVSCVVKVVEDTNFEPLPKELEWSYTFAFEAF